MQISTQDIEQMELLLAEAIKKGDIVFLEKTIHDDLLCLAPNGEMVTKAADMASHRAGTMVVDYLKPSVEQINIVDDIAIAVVNYNTKGKMMGKPIEGKFRYLRVWKKFNEGLKVVAASCLQATD